VKGVVSDDGRITCPWSVPPDALVLFIYLITCRHGACFDTTNGFVENAPALDHLNAFHISVKDGAVYVRGDENSLKTGRRVPNIACSPRSAERVLIVGGGSGAIGAVEGIREKGYTGKVTVLSKEAYLPIDRVYTSMSVLWYDEADML